MEETFFTKAIVLKREPYREKDSLVSVYSPDLGKKILIARGTASPRSKLAGHIEPMTEADIMIVKGKGRDYLGSSVCRNRFPGLRADYVRLAAGGRMMRFFDFRISGQEKDPDLYELLKRCLEVVSDASLPERKLSILSGIFSLQLSAAAGYLPEVKKCTRCRQTLRPAANFFDFSAGGAVCPSCLSSNEKLSPISADAIKMVRICSREDIGYILKISMRKKLEDELNAFAGFFAEWTFGQA